MKITHLPLVATLAFVAAHAPAQAFAGDWYALVSGGQSKVKSATQDEVNAELIDLGVTGLSSSLDDNDTAYKLQLGYKFSENWAIEGGYVDMGQFDYNSSFTGPVAGSASAQVEATGWNAAALVALPLTDRFAMFGKLGIVSSKVKINARASGSGDTFTISDSATSTTGNWGIGATFNVIDQVAVRAEWERFNNLGDEEQTGEGDIDMLSIGIVLIF